MSEATDALISNAKCIEPCVPHGYYLPILISIFAKIAGMSTDTNTLISNARCIEQCVPAGMQLPVLIWLANQLLGGGTGGGVGGVSSGHGAPTFTPTGSGALYKNVDTGVTFFWDPVNGWQ